MRPIKRWMGALGACAAALALGVGFPGCDVDQEEEGRLPEVETEDEGELPEYEIETPDVEFEEPDEAEQTPPPPPPDDGGR